MKVYILFVEQSLPFITLLKVIIQLFIAILLYFKWKWVPDITKSMIEIMQDMFMYNLNIYVQCMLNVYLIIYLIYI